MTVVNERCLKVRGIVFDVEMDSTAEAAQRESRGYERLMQIAEEDPCEDCLAMNQCIEEQEERMARYVKRTRNLGRALVVAGLAISGFIIFEVWRFLNAYAG